MDVDLSTYAICSYRDFIDDIVINHTNNEANRSHLPILLVNGRQILTETYRNLLDVVKNDDIITVRCGEIDSIRELLSAGPRILNRLLMSIPVYGSDEEREESDVIVTIPMGEFDKIGEEVSEFDEGTICAICQEVMKKEEILKKLPCRDIFHISCIKNWLTGSSPFCPLCRRETSASRRYL